MAVSTFIPLIAKQLTEMHRTTRFLTSHCACEHFTYDRMTSGYGCIFAVDYENVMKFQNERRLASVR